MRLVMVVWMVLAVLFAALGHVQLVQEIVDVGLILMILAGASAGMALVAMGEARLDRVERRRRRLRARRV
jgi:uncharacterized integral membrane protein